MHFLEMSWEAGEASTLRGQSWIEDENSAGRKEGEPGAQKLCSSPAQCGGLFLFHNQCDGPTTGVALPPWPWR